MGLRKWLLLSVALCAALLLVGRAVTTLVVDHAWYSSMGVVAMFWEQFADSLLLRGTTWLAGSVFAFVNLYAVRRTILAIALPSRVANIEMTAMLPSRRLLSITILLSVVVGLMVSLPFTDWTTVAMARHAIPFGEIEGILDRDLGFYVFQLPLEELLYLWALALLVSVIAVVVLMYAITRSLRVDGRRIIASHHVRRHFSVLGALVLMLLAWSYRLDAFDLLQFGSGADGLFLSIDHDVALRADRVLVVICALASLIFLRAGWMGQVRLAFFTLSVVLMAALGGRHLLPIALTGSALIGDPIRRDQPYAATRTFFSRRAYDVDAMQLVASEPTSALRPRLAPAEMATNVSLWDASDVRRRTTGSRSGEIDVGNIGWSVGANERAQAVTVRRSATGTGPWSVYASDVTGAELQARRLDMRMSFESDDGLALPDGLNEPLVAPGLRTRRLVREQAGVQGTPLQSVGMRIAHAWDARDLALLAADTMSGSVPRLVSHRDVRERISRLTPMFTQGEQVVPLLYDDAIVWAINLYSASDHYPLSQRWIVGEEEQSYFRFTATALIDATTGRVRLVPGDRLDPVARVWLAVVSALVVPATELPVALSAQLPPAIESARVQVQTFARFGSRRASSRPRFVADSMVGVDAPTLYHVASTFGVVPAWSVPVLDGKGRVDGIMTVVGGRSRATLWDSTTGTKADWALPRDQIRTALDSMAVLAEQGRRAPRLRRGHMQVLSGEQGPVMVQSLIGTHTDGGLFVSRVAVLDGANRYFGSTIADALAIRLGSIIGAQPFVDAGMTAGASRDRRVTLLYEAMRDALKRGEWVRFGATFDTLGIVLGRPPL